MKGNLGPHRSRYIFVFYEKTEYFIRYDIINRILNSIYTLFQDVEPIIIVILEMGTETVVQIYNKYDSLRIVMSYVNFVELVRSILGRYCRDIMVLSEQGKYVDGSISNTNCLILGLHLTDPISIANDIKLGYQIVSLGDISYLTSQCLQIIGYIRYIIKDTNRVRVK